MSKIAGANGLFFKIAGAKAPITPVLNTPLSIVRSPFGQKSCCHVFKLREYKEKKRASIPTQICFQLQLKLT